MLRDTDYCVFSVLVLTTPYLQTVKYCIVVRILHVVDSHCSIIEPHLSKQNQHHRQHEQ